MALFNELGSKGLSCIAGGTIAKGAACKFSAAVGNKITVVVGTAATEVILGIATEAASTSDLPLVVQTGGIALCLASAAISAGAQVEVGASGKIETAGGATAHSIGVALEAATADGDLIPVLLNLPNLNGPANS